MKSPWKKISGKIVYKNPWTKFQEDKVIRPDGKNGIYGFLKKADSAVSVALSRDNQIYLIKQWRYIFKRNTIELPWGGCEKNESPLQAAKRELQEEAGVMAKKWKSLGAVIVCPGLSNERAHMFLATDLKKVKANPDGTEIIEVLKVPFSKAYVWACNGKINDAVAIASILRVKEIVKL